MSRTTESGGRQGISVLLPVRNAEKWFGSALQSLHDQTRPADEILIIDDGSSDNSMEIAERLTTPRLRIVEGPQSGLAAALQVGVLESRYDLVARMDADDLAHPNRIELQERYLRFHPEIVACGSWARTIDSGSRSRLIRTPTRPADIRLLLSLYNPIIHPSVMFRRSAVLEVGGYQGPTSRAFPEDYDLWLRLVENGKIGVIGRALLKYRVHPESLSRQHALQLASDSYELALRSFRGYELRQSDLEALSIVLSWIHRQTHPPISGMKSMVVFSRTIRILESQLADHGSISIETRMRLARLALKFALTRAQT